MADQAARNDDLRRILTVVRSVVLDVSDGRGLGRLRADVSFERELGLGSLERVELAVRVGEAFGVTLDEQAIATADTPRQLLDQVRARLPNGAGADLPPATHRSAAERSALLPSSPPAAEPTESTTLVEVLEYHVRHQPDRVHIVLEDDDGAATPITYRRLHTEATAVARALRERGLAPGRCVAIMLPTSIGYFASFMGTMMAGGIPVPLYPPVRLDRITEYIGRCAKILDNAQAQALITFDRAARVAQIARDRVATVEHVLSIEAVVGPKAKASDPGPLVCAEVTPTDTALIQYTSGSTGDPKGVELTQANVLANIRSAREGCGLGPKDVVVSWLPLYHDMGLIGGWLMPLYHGVPTVLMSPMAFLARPQRWLRALSEYGGTCSVAPNFAFDLCVKRIDDADLEGVKLHQIRALLNGSEPILPATLDRFIDRFGAIGLRRDALFCAYGLAENMVAVTFPPPGRGPRIDRVSRERFEHDGHALAADDDEADALQFVGVGSAVPRHEVVVVDAEGSPVAERQEGTVWFRGPSSFKGYYRRPDATAEVQRADGWVDTGDLGYIADGELYITGRKKDLIIKGGRNYYPHEIEAAAAAVDGIRTGCVAAFAQRDEATGTEQVVVVAETREEDSMEREFLVAKVIDSVSARVGLPPDQVVLALPGAVPKTSSGKIRRRETRRLFEEGSLNRDRGSFARQAAGLYLGSVPTRASALARKAGRTLYGGYAAGAIGSALLAAPVLGRFLPPGPTSRKLAAFEAATALRLAGLSPHITGQHNLPEGAVIFAANHASYLDFLICVTALPTDTRFVIKGELRDNAMVGPLLRRLEHVFIDRYSTARSLADLDEVVRLLDEGRRVILFPEGTFCADVGMRPFKLGTFRLACSTGTPVVPVVIRGSRKALRDGTWLPRHQRIELELLPALQPAGREIADIVRLRDRCAQAIAAKLDEPRLFAADISIQVTD